ncbi:hypothetical protein BDA96_10G309700 [Sorghum bicolor]|uniref:Uncharacterized protein n=1 Tax=Sorghum bicolor TaxID=4558 RepID=A0A921Q7V5_SORBI|nr:hypothetical protein BDA96_10G309700 [Sorghum bicolor]
MASLARAAAAALPSLRARHLGSGSGRLPLAALSGRGAAVLAVLATAEFKVPFPRSASAVKATNAESHDRPAEGADDHSESDEEFELVRELKAALDRKINETSGVKILLLDEDDVPHSIIYQNLLESYVKESFAVWAKVTSRFRPPTESKLYEGLRLCGETFISAVVSCHDCRATWKNMSEVVEALDLLRRLVSSTLKAPLPLDWSLRWAWDAPKGDDDAERGLVYLVHRISVLMVRDINSMLKLDDAN